MFRRWLIRSFFIALCVVCVKAWMGSYCVPFDVEYFEKAGNHTDSFALRACYEL